MQYKGDLQVRASIWFGSWMSRGVNYRVNNRVLKYSVHMQPEASNVMCRSSLAKRLLQ